jgi:hypothetical protein
MSPVDRDIGREVLRILLRTGVVFLLLLAVLILWRGSTIFLYEGF